MSASAIIADVRALLTGEPVFLAGSLVASETYGKDDAFSDVDIFCPTQQVLVYIVTKLQAAGFSFGDEKFARVWHRWLRYGMKNWHTNSMRMLSPHGVEFNLVYKTTDGHAATSLSQVLESFDFGLLATGYDLESNRYRDLRPYLFPDEMAKYTNGEPLPMMPNKRSNWRQGFISQYNGIREGGRYAKYAGYGYDMSLVKDDLVVGYREAAAHWVNDFDPQRQLLGKIFDTIGDYIEDDDIDGLAEASKKIEYKSELTVIMEALE